MTISRGFTLLELLVVLSLLGVLLGVALPPTARWRDRMAVRAARDEIAAAISWTRISASSHGGATLILDPATATLWTVTAAGRSESSADLDDRYRVEVDVGRSGPVHLRFDALGIGRIASRRITVRRGSAEGGVVVSAYGRVRRW